MHTYILNDPFLHNTVSRSDSKIDFVFQRGIYYVSNQCETQFQNVIYTCHVHIPNIHMICSCYSTEGKNKLQYKCIYIYIYIHIYISIVWSVEILLFVKQSPTILAHTSIAPYAALSLNSGIPFGESINPNGCFFWFAGAKKNNMLWFNFCQIWPT